MYEDIISHILKENQRYHEALEEIANCSEQGNPIYLREVAREENRESDAFKDKVAREVLEKEII